jgi:hypothetical protein
MLVSILSIYVFVVLLGAGCLGIVLVLFMGNLEILRCCLTVTQKSVKQNVFFIFYPPHRIPRATPFFTLPCHPAVAKLLLQRMNPLPSHVVTLLMHLLSDLISICILGLTPFKTKNTLT